MLSSDAPLARDMCSAKAAACSRTTFCNDALQSTISLSHSSPSKVTSFWYSDALDENPFFAKRLRIWVVAALVWNGKCGTRWCEVRVTCLNGKWRPQAVHKIVIVGGRMRPLLEESSYLGTFGHSGAQEILIAREMRIARHKAFAAPEVRLP